MSEEGLLTLWRGSAPTVGRAMAMNLGMLTSYDEIKERLNDHKGTHDDLQTRVFASAVAGVICSFLSLPFDNVKVIYTISNLVYLLDSLCCLSNISRQISRELNGPQLII